MSVSGGHGFLRRLNEAAILKALRVQPGLTRGALALQLGLSRAAVGKLVDGLMAAACLREHSEQGIRALLLDEQHFVLLGADVDADRIILAAVSLQGSTRAMLELSVNAAEPEAVFATLGHQISEMARRHQAMGQCVLGVGVSVPGPVCPSSGELLYSEKTGWQALPARALLQRSLAQAGAADLPLYLLRANNCIARQAFEQHSSVLAGAAMAYVHVGEEINLSLAREGSLVLGQAGMAGQIGHYVLDPDGPSCACGRRGCANVLATLAAARQACGLSCTAFAERLRLADVQALDALHDAGRCFARVLLDLEALLGVGEYLVGGPAFQEGGHFLAAAQEVLAAVDVAPAVRVVRFEQTRWAQGAALRVLEKLLSPELLAQADCCLAVPVLPADSRLFARA